MTIVYDEGNYQMFWNCSSCGIKKLLGVTHRHCPNCGSAQDETKRYFPNDGSEISLKNHIYYGIDWDCRYCSTPNSKNSSICCNCGAPHKDSPDVQLIVRNNATLKKTINNISNVSLNTPVIKVFSLLFPQMRQQIILQ